MYMLFTLKNDKICMSNPSKYYIKLYLPIEKLLFVILFIVYLKDIPRRLKSMSSL